MRHAYKGFARCRSEAWDSAKPQMDRLTQARDNR